MMEQTYVAAGYCRLSRDDGGIESVSIETQKTMISDYCKTNNILLYNLYCDDGYTGTNFDRPGFQQMMKDVKDGKVNTVIVKDLSRMGRNYTSVGDIMENQFADYGVRFISLGDNIDNGMAEYDSFFFAMKNVFNEMYPLDCSKKTRMALNTKAKNGQFVGSKAPYGYKKSEKDKHILEIDENVADNVKLIFSLAEEQGYGFNKIANVLRERKIPTPKEYANKVEEPKCDWNLATVKKMLNDEVYLGNIIYGKRHKVSFKSKKIVRQAREKWIIVENTHPALISKEQWDNVHEKLSSRKRKRFDGTISMFAGLVYCDKCGYAMSLSPSKTQDDFYVCNTYKKKGKDRCSIHFIYYKDLCEIVRQDIQRQIRQFAKDEEGYAEKLKQQVETGTSVHTEKLSKEIARLKEEIEKTENVIASLYEDKVMGKIPEENFTAILNKQNIKKKELYEKFARTKVEYEKSIESEHSVEYFLNIIKEVKRVRTLSPELLNTLIDRIEVGEKYEVNGKKRQDIKIRYKYVGNILL